MKTKKQKIEELKKDIDFVFNMVDLNTSWDELSEIIAKYLVAKGYRNCKDKKLVSSKRYYNLRQEACAPVLASILRRLERDKEFYIATEQEEKCRDCLAYTVDRSISIIKRETKLNQVYLEEKDVTNDDN